MFQFKKVQKMQNLGNAYIWGSPFVMSRTDVQNRVYIIFKLGQMIQSQITYVQSKKIFINCITITHLHSHVSLHLAEIIS